MFFNRRVFIISLSSKNFTLRFLCIYIARAEYCFIPYDARFPRSRDHPEGLIAV